MKRTVDNVLLVMVPGRFICNIGVGSDRWLVVSREWSGDYGIDGGYGFMESEVGF